MDNEAKRDAPITIEDFELFVRENVGKKRKFTIEEKQRLEAVLPNILEGYTDSPITSLPVEILLTIIDLSEETNPRYVCKAWNNIIRSREKILPRNTPESVKKGWILIHLLKHSLVSITVDHKWNTWSYECSFSTILTWDNTQECVQIMIRGTEKPREIILDMFPFEETPEGFSVKPATFVSCARRFFEETGSKTRGRELAFEPKEDPLLDFIYQGSAYYLFDSPHSLYLGPKTRHELQHYFGDGGLPKWFRGTFSGKLWENEEFQKAVCRIPEEFIKEQK